MEAEFTSPFGMARLREACMRAMREQGFDLKRLPGRGLAYNFECTKAGLSQTAAFKTSRDRYIAFERAPGQEKWKTLEDVDVVVVATVDAVVSPQNVEVYLLPTAAVKARFDDAFVARKAEGHLSLGKYGMWLYLDRDMRPVAAAVGSGLAEAYRPIARYSIADLDGSANESGESTASVEEDDEVMTPTTVGEVMAFARQRIAEIAGVRIEAVKLDLKIEL
jgi:hypothetical protein